MSNRKVGYILCAIGVIIVFVSYSADAIGIGQQSGIGSYQIMGADIGIVMVILGVWLALRNRH
jgi:hypothetical protein